MADERPLPQSGREGDKRRFRLFLDLRNISSGPCDELDGVFNLC